MLEFDPALSELFLAFAVQGLCYCGEKASELEMAFIVRLGYERPNLFTEEARKLYLDRLSIDKIEVIRNTPKQAFLVGWRADRVT